MKFNEWVTFIKESRDWCINKCWLIDCRLIERCDDGDDDGDGAAIDAAVVGLLRRLWDELMRILLAFRVSVWRRVWGVMGDYACCMRGVIEKEDCSRNLCSIWRLWLIWARWKQI